MEPEDPLDSSKNETAPPPTQRAAAVLAGEPGRRVRLVAPSQDSQPGALADMEDSYKQVSQL